jgi:hypothetical protein
MLACVPIAGNLQPGMTPDQAIREMGDPEAKESIPDPNLRGGDLLRYSWTSKGKAATFGRDNRLVKVESVTPDANAQSGPDFDPISTPLSYIFYPLRVGIGWLASGVNCVAENNCQPPPPPRPPGAG